MSTEHDSPPKALSAKGVRQIAITWDNHAGERWNRIAETKSAEQQVGERCWWPLERGLV